MNASISLTCSWEYLLILHTSSRVSGVSSCEIGTSYMALYLLTGKQAPRAWREKDQPKTEQPQKWNSPLPEWASDDSVTSTTVGTFDSSGNFTASAEKVKLIVCT